MSIRKKTTSKNATVDGSTDFVADHFAESEKRACFEVNRLKFDWQFSLLQVATVYLFWCYLTTVTKPIIYISMLVMRIN